MKKFKEFVKEEFSYRYKTLDLHEELDDSQKSIVDGWVKTGAAQRISKHVFPEGQDRITIPVHGHEDPPPSEPHPEVKAHLEKHGYSISDYRGGFANDKYGRKVSIGKVLNKTKATPNVMNAFTTDPARSGASVKNPKIIISRHPHDVAAMSTNRGWISCMTMPGDKKKPEGGMFNNHLEDDVQRGTHVAYLVHHNDDNISNPIARIALKPFHAPEGSSTILRPEPTVYGIGKGHDEREGTSLNPLAKAFKQTVHSWATTHFPAEEDKVYRKDQAVYHDGGSQTIMSLDKQLNHHDPSIVAAAFTDHHGKITPEHIEKGMNHDDYDVGRAALSHPAATEDQLRRAIDNHPDGIGRTALAHPNAPMDKIENVIHNQHASYLARRSALSNPKLKEHHLDSILNDETEDPSIHAHALSHPNAPEKHVNRFISDKTANLEPRLAAMQNPKADPEAIRNVLKDNSEGTNMRVAAAKHPSVKTEHIDEALSQHQTIPYNVKRLLLKNPKLSDKMMTHFVNHGSDFDQESVLKNPRLNSTHLQPSFDAVGSSDFKRLPVIQHGSATAEQLHKLITNPNEHEDAHRAAAVNPNLSSESIDHIMDHMHHDSYLQTLAMEHKNASSEALHKGVSSSHPNVIRTATEHINVTPEHLDKAFDNPNTDIETKRTIADRSITSKETIMKALGHDDKQVRRAATHSYQIKDEDLASMANHPNRQVRSGILQHMNFGKKSFDKLSQDSDETIRAAALVRGGKHAEPHHTDAAVNDPSPTVRAISVDMKHLTPEHITKLSNDPDATVRKSVASHNYTPIEHLQRMATSDPDADVRKYAANTIKIVT